MLRHVSKILQSYPNEVVVDLAILEECIRACYHCAQTCWAAADILLSEGSRGEDFIHCVRQTLACAGESEMTGRLLLQQTNPDWSTLRKQLESCVASCRHCGDACCLLREEYAICALSSEACRETERLALQLLDIIPQQKRMVKVSVPLSEKREEIYGPGPF